MLATLNIFFLVLHSGLIVFNVFGWIWPKTRPWNLLTQVFTLGSWVGMGAFKGWGYCYCTDIHWRIRRDMGITNDPDTYIGFLIERVTGLKAGGDFVFWLGLSVFTVCFFASFFLNIRDVRRRKMAQARL